MSSSADALTIIQALVRRTRSARFTFSALTAFAEKWLAKAVEEKPELEDFADSPSNMLTAYLVELAKEKEVTLQYAGGAITGIYYPGYYHAIVRQAYDRIDAQPERLFPSEEGLTASIPSDVLSPVDIKSDFVSWIGKSDIDPPVLLRVMYPEGVHSMVVSSDLMTALLPKLCVQKIRQYLRSERNAGYMRSKLASIFRQREMAMKDMLGSILTTPDKALRTVQKPTDFTFHFWTQLSSTIIKEYSQKKDKLPEEHAVCQAAYMLGYFNVHYRGVVQRDRDTETALRNLENNLRKPPYTFTISEIHGFTDKQGVPLTKKYGLDDANAYIAEKIKPKEESALAEMVRLKTPNEKEYYLYRDYILNVAIEGVFDARKEFRDHYVDSWSEAMRVNKRVPEMTDDDAFEKDVRSRVREQKPVLFSLLNYNLLFLTMSEVNVPGELAAELKEILDQKEARLKPYADILNLQRRKLYADARLLLPFWQAIPLLAGIVQLLKRLFVGKSEEEKLARKERRAPRKASAATPAGTTMRYSPSGAAPEQSETPVTDADSVPAGGGSTNRRAQIARFKEVVRTLQSRYVPKGSTPERTLAELADRWNPLLDPVAQGNLVEDVNSLARDFLRRMKVSFRLIPPNQHRVQEWADRLVQNDAFSQIRRRDDLMEYLKLYMLTVLGK